MLKFQEKSVASIQNKKGLTKNENLKLSKIMTGFVIFSILIRGLNIRQFNNIDFSSEVSTVHKFEYTNEALLLVRQ